MELKRRLRRSAVQCEKQGSDSEVGSVAAEFDSGLATAYRSGSVHPMIRRTIAELRPPGPCSHTNRLKPAATQEASSGERCLCFETRKFEKDKAAV